MRKLIKINGDEAKGIAKKLKSFSSPSKKGAKSGSQRILDFVRCIERSSGNPNVPRETITVLCEIKPTTFSVTLSNMKKKGLIQYNKDTVRLTEKGLYLANEDAVFSMDNCAAQADIKAKFKIGGKSALLFDQLTDGLVHERKSILDRVGFTNKNSAAVTLSNLKKNGVIEYDRSTIKMTGLCFPFGRPTKAAPAKEEEAK